MNVDAKKVGLFMKELSDVEFIYLTNIIPIVKGIKEYIKKYPLSKNEFCEKFDVKPTNYQNFISGNYEYNIMHVAKLNAAFAQKAIEEIAKEDTITFE